MERNFSFSEDFDIEEVKKLAIRITDMEKDNYDIDTNVENWHKSNPFGYAIWFFDKAVTSTRKMFSLNESVDPVRAFENKKLPLQRVVQLLKRHRDIMFSSDKFESDINPITGKIEKWVQNPVNNLENYADKWSEVKQKEDYFYLWLDKLEEDLDRLSKTLGKGQDMLFESFSDMYGNNVSKKTFSNIGERKRLSRENGNLFMATGTGLLGSSGVEVKKHGFEGNLDGK